ncbi:MAG: SBBP repeat-containing protein [Bacteroidales bacterium]|nr:SBBP repeat-containing protein [Bacteroidales bacterium]
MTKSCLYFLILMIPAGLFAQVSPDWSMIYNGNDDYFDNGVAIALDPSGNVFVGGTSVSITNGAPNYVVLKYTSAGEFKWSYEYDGTGAYEDFLAAITTDSEGNVYATGGSHEGSSRRDYVTLKIDGSGAFAWKSIYKGLDVNNDDDAADIVVDDDGYVYVTGASAGYSSSMWADFATLKLTPGGDTVWTRRLGGSGMPNDRATAIAVDNLGYVYITGYFEGDVSTRYNYATAKYKPNGDTAWVRVYNGTGSDDDRAYAIAVDDDRNVYVTGASWGLNADDYATVKYDSNGVQKWVARYNGPAGSYDKAWDLKLDDEGNVYVTGQSGGTSGNYDYCTIRYNPDGGEDWVARYNGPDNLDDVATSVAIDPSGNIFVTGYSYNPPSPYISTTDMVLIKYNPEGLIEWVSRFDGPGNNYDQGYAIAADPSGDVFVTGSTEYYGQQNSRDIFTVKYAGPSLVEDFSSGNSINLYPNPADHQLTVQVPCGAALISVCDLTGRQIIVQEFKVPEKDEQTFNISGIPSGAYIVKVTTTLGISEKKLIVY